MGFFHCKVRELAKDKRYLSISLTQDDRNEFTKFLNILLGYDSFLGRKTKSFAEKLLSQRLERKKAEEMVEIAWDSLLEGPDDLLVYFLKRVL